MPEKFHDSVERRASDSTAESEACVIKEEREGGVAAWLTVLGSALVYYASMGVLNSFGFFNNYYSHDFLQNTPTSTIAFIGTLQIALMNSLAAVSGALCDHYGVRWLYAGAGSGTAAGLLILSFAQPGCFWQVFLVQGLLVGFAAAFGAQPALTVVGQHFKQQRAVAMGFVAAGSALGGIGFPLMFESLLPLLGFQWMLRVAALKVAVIYLVAIAISTSKPIGKIQHRDCGSLIDFRGFFDIRYAVLCVGGFFAQLGQWIPSYYIKMYTNAAYPGNSVSEYFLPVLNGCSILGAVLGGFLGDHLGRLNLLWPIVMFTGCICIFIWLLIDSLAATVLFVCLYGFGTGIFTALLPSVVGQITPDENLGARVGAFYSVVAIASLVGTPIGSALITTDDKREGYWWLIVFSGTAITIGSLFMLSSRLLHDKNLRKKW
ncbi:major facilitator superfamily domain-containing protein [Boeremia exigua]|uniref:major facilitator superfamily domain-containing protein n=1 Tax=Boeremia exigua TaxID=749465 RepID=UPI001E8E541B|nr:major facilitator superfamily domain-containing protein [Boeremia exigua]KAH6620246.1 major facilitator superfamily domain-containing protein [Boeremia exigua]